MRFTVLLVSFLLGFLSFTSQSFAEDGFAEPASSMKAVLVTGASSGIGKQIALKLAKNGFYVYAGARKPKDIRALSKIPNVQGIRLDVTVNEEIERAVMHIAKEGRGLHGLVNNAGVFLYDPMIEVSENDMRFILDVNVLGPYRVTKAFAPLLIKSKGRISTIGSVAGLFSGSLFGPYGISKHSMEAFSEALAQEMDKFGVSVSVVEPGNFRSNIMKNMKKRMKEIDSGKRTTLFRDELEGMASFTKSDRSHHADAEPVADAILHFMTSDSPKFRYLVTPNQAESDYVMTRAIKKLIELNADHRFSLSDKEFTALFTTVLKGAAK